MAPNVGLSLLYALRVQLDAVILALESELGMSATAPVEAGSCPNCGAGPDFVKDTSTLDGTKRSYCTNCRHEWERV